MSNQELIERYVYAVVKYLPGTMKKDVEKELETLIEDMLEERCGAVPPTEKDVRVVMAELGTPQELANNYSPDKDKSLIGAPYYGIYKRVLAIVMITYLAGMTIAKLLELAVTAWEKPLPPTGWAIEAVSWMGTLAAGAIFVFAFITLLFAFFQRKKISVNDITDNNWESLPRPPKNQEKIKKGEVFGDIIMSVAMVIVFIAAPQILCGIFQIEGETVVIPALNIEVLRSTWYLIILFLLIGVGRDVFQYFEGRYTRRLALVTGICDVLSGFAAAVWLTCYNLMNPVFLETVGKQFGTGENQMIVLLFENFQTFFLIVILFALLLDFSTVLFKAVKYDRIEKN